MSNGEKKVIVLGGPTASGKTALAIKVAKALGGSIISADSRQFYREIPIGTAQPTAEELALAPHFFIADRAVTKPRSAADFEKEALAKIEELHRTNNPVIVVGGSGLYLDALIYGLDDMPEVPKDIRDHYGQLFSKEGLEGLQKLVAQHDPEYYQLADIQNPRRLIRALEVMHVSGRPYSTFRSGKKALRPFQVTCFAIDWPREELYKRINERVGFMMDMGLEAEARKMLPFRNLSPLKTVGYTELFKYFDGHWSLETALSEIQKNTRRYAKRQLTWFRARPDFQWIAPNEDILPELLNKRPPLV
jgi:tRNA dimethylallyltransferase